MQERTIGICSSDQRKQMQRKKEYRLRKKCFAMEFKIDEKMFSGRGIKILAAWLLSGFLFLAPPVSAAEDAGERFVPNAYQSGLLPLSLPFFSLNGHMLIDGAVDGKQGKFLFDTGTEFAFFLNNNYLKLEKEQFIARGNAASGQEMVLYRQRAPLSSIEIGKAIRFETVRGFTHADWSFLEEGYGIPAFLGSVGHGFNRNYLFVIDYDVQSITFYPYDERGHVRSLVVDPEKVVARFEFTPTGVAGKIPEVAMHVGDGPIAAFFDTGNLGTLELTESMQTVLAQKGLLKLTPSEYAYGTYESVTRAELKGLRHERALFAAIRNLMFTSGTKNRIGLGYQFLKNHISVWDYQNRTLTLLRP